MDDVLAGRDLRLTYLRERSAIETLLERHGHGDAAWGQSAALAWDDRCRPDRLNHLVLATNNRSGQILGMFAARDQMTTREPYLLIETVTADPAYPTLALRMLGMVIMRGIEAPTMPIAIAAPKGNPALLDALVAGHNHILGSVFDRGSDQVVVHLQTAALRLRIARGIGAGFKPAVLDLRGVGIEALMAGAGRLYRARAARRKPVRLLATAPR